MPAGIDDPARPSGGNVYDRRMLDGLRGLGWLVHEHQVAGAWPTPDVGALAGLAHVLAGLPDAALVLVDGLVASAASVVLPSASARLRTVVLVHMPLGPDAGRGGRPVRRGRGGHHQPGDSCPSARVVRPAPGPRRASPAPTWPRWLEAGGRAQLLCVATVHRGKGHDLMLDALAEVEDRPGP